MSVKKNGEERKKAISTELKPEILDKHEYGVRVIYLAIQFNCTILNDSMICIILKQKDLIKAITPAKCAKIILKLCNSVHEKNENRVFL